MTPRTVNGRPSSAIDFPGSEGSPSKRRRHRLALITATSSGSSARNVRPASGSTPSTEKNAPSAETAVSRSDSRRALEMSAWSARSRQSLEGGALLAERLELHRADRTRSSDPAARRDRRAQLRPYTWTSRSGSPNGNGRNSTPLTTLKIAAVAPVASASVSTTVAAKPGFLQQRTSAEARVLSDLSEDGHRGLLQSVRRQARSSNRFNRSGATRRGPCDRERSAR